jgi:hypothetical protein
MQQWLAGRTLSIIIIIIIIIAVTVCSGQKDMVRRLSFDLFLAAVMGCKWLKQTTIESVLRAAAAAGLAGPWH